jgi:hypothetical protein
MEDFTACGNCNRGGGGNDKDKCSCGWREFKVTALGCYLGTPIVGQRQEPPKLTRSQARFARYREVSDCFESFRDFIKYESLKSKEAII